jgi:NADH-ubiquinone oxidoreductase chain 4L
MTSPLLYLLPLPLLLIVLLYLSQRTHLLIALLAVEAIVLTLLIFILLSHALVPQRNSFFLFLLLTLGACEARLGLAILVAISRAFGSDLLTTLSLNKC